MKKETQITDKPFVYGMSVEGGNFTDRAKETTRFLKNGSPRSSCRPHDDMTAAREPPTAQDIVFHISKTVMTKSTNTILKGIRHALDTGMLMYEMRTLLLGLYQGFVEIGRLPHLVGVQSPSSSDPLPMGTKM